jgi:hypothetical protein
MKVIRFGRSFYLEQSQFKTDCKQLLNWKWLSSGMLGDRPVMVAVRSSETSVSINQTTRRNILEHSYLHTRCENLKNSLIIKQIPTLLL